MGPTTQKCELAPCRPTLCCGVLCCAVRSSPVATNAWMNALREPSFAGCTEYKGKNRDEIRSTSACLCANMQRMWQVLCGIAESSPGGGDGSPWGAQWPDSTMLFSSLTPSVLFCDPR